MPSAQEAATFAAHRHAAGLEQARQRHYDDQDDEEEEEDDDFADEAQEEDGDDADDYEAADDGAMVHPLFVLDQHDFFHIRNNQMYNGCT